MPVMNAEGTDDARLTAVREHLERKALVEFLPRQRWFARKARTISSLRIVDETRLGELAAGLVLFLVETTYREGGADTYFVPLVVCGPTSVATASNDPRVRVVSRFDHADGTITLFDGLSVPEAGRALLTAMEQGSTLPTREGRIRTSTTSAYPAARGPASQSLQVIPIIVEQSNSAVVFGDRLILKVFRRVEPGVNPDLEIGRFLTERTSFEHVPVTAGAFEYDRAGSEPATLAILQGLVKHEGSGWDFALRQLRAYFARVRDRTDQEAPTATESCSIFELAREPIPNSASVVMADDLAAARLLGTRTAELHLALASDSVDPNFAPEPLQFEDFATLRDDIREQSREVQEGLRRRLQDFGPDVQPAAQRALDEAGRLLVSLGHDSEHVPNACKIRCHGDYHLGQVLRTRVDFVILDFEGEPARPIAKRREKQSPIKDVVGMLRSFDYAAFAAVFEATRDRPSDIPRLMPWARAWQTWTSVEFLKSYRETVGESPILPRESTDLSAIFRHFTLDKTLYELSYEINNRPDWVRIPLQGILTLIDESMRERSTSASSVAPSAGTRTQNVSSPWLSDFDLHLLTEGTHLRSYEKLGAHVTECDGARGVKFAVWAPNARSVAVTGDFNGWNANADLMTPRWPLGVWEQFIPGIGPGTRYKYAITSQVDGYEIDKADPYGFAAEVRPQTASIVADLSTYAWGDGQWMHGRAQANSLGAPVSIYEVHLGSWMRVPEEGNRWLTYKELAQKLAVYVKHVGFTHVEFLPLAEHPFDGSWGYQPVGYYAPTSRYGTPADFMELVDVLHQNGIGVILDWVPAHFPDDAHGLSYFDGTHLYEHADPRQGKHKDWNTFIFNFGRPQVANFLISNALFWLDKYHIDGLRVDAVASMLYLDYSRREGEWIPNQFGGRENLEAIALLRRVNETVHAEFPGALTIAEESTAWPMVTRPTTVGGLGFDLKWDMGWMHDTLAYFAIDPIERKLQHDKLTFRGLYAFTENFVLPLSHDEVVYGKRSLVGKMPGDAWQKFASVRLLLGWMFAQPGKKLLFMGDELGQWREWNHDVSLDWHLLHEPLHEGLQRWVRDLNTLYRGEPALHQLDCHPAGFTWADCNDREQSVVSLFRKGRDAQPVVLFVANFTPVPRHNYRVGVPFAGFWEEILNGDAEIYRGSGQGNIGGAKTTPVHWHGHPQSVNLVLPPLAAIALRFRATS